MIGVIVPAHNEESLIGCCLDSILRAAFAPALCGEQVAIVVVLDACTDRTKDIATVHGVELVEIDAKNVGIARAEGAKFAIDLGARWLAFTDADTNVAPDWLASHLSLGVDAVCGTVAVSDWEAYGLAMQHHFEATYTDADGHSHIHGANLSVCVQAYLTAGGFSPVASSEDVALVGALESSGARIAWSAAPRVWTSARRVYRAPGGFGATIERIAKLQVELELPS